MNDRELLRHALFWIKGITLPATNELAEKISARLAQPIQPDYSKAGFGQPQPEPEPVAVGNTITFMTRAIFNVIVKHQEINGGYFIPEGDVAVVVDRLAKTINSTFAPLSAPPRKEWQGLTDEEMFAALVQADPLTKRLAPGFEYFARAIEAKLREKNEIR